jgi:hypothetical protein
MEANESKVDEKANESKVDENWIKLVSKLGNHPKDKNLILMPEEVVLLRKKMGEMTRQLLELSGFSGPKAKYQSLMSMLGRIGASVEAAEEDSGDALTPSSPSADDVPDSGSHSGGGGGRDQVDPEDLHNTYTPEPVRPVAGGA